MKSLIADAFTAMRAEQSTWHEFVDKIDWLRERGAVSEIDYVLLRQSLQTRALILVDTGRQPEAFTEASVERVLAKAHRNIAAQALDDAATAREDATIARAAEERERLEKESLVAAQVRIAAARQQRLESGVDRITRLVTVGLMSVLGIVALIGAIFSIPGMADGRTSGTVGLGVSACVVVLSALGLYSIVTERGFPWASRELQRRLRPSIRVLVVGRDDDAS